METTIQNKSNKVKKLKVRLEPRLANNWLELRNYIHRRARAVSLSKELV